MNYQEISPSPEIAEARSMIRELCSVMRSSGVEPACIAEALLFESFHQNCFDVPLHGHNCRDFVILAASITIAHSREHHRKLS